MKTIIISLASCYVLINLVSFITYWADKAKARRNSRRIRERTLHLLALVGGVWGAIAAMLLVRHKTSKSSFFLVTIFITIVNIGYIAGAVYLYMKYL